MEPKERGPGGPVSYTHLDVYKRQAQAQDSEDVQERVSRVRVDGSGRESMSEGGWSCSIFTTDQDVMCSFSKNSADELENWQLEWEVME